MPDNTPYVTLKKGNRIADFPRENLAKAKALGWIEVPVPKGKVSTDQGAIDETSFIENMRASMGLPPKGGIVSDIKDLGTGAKTIATHPIESAKMVGGSMLEAQQGTAERAAGELKDPDWMKKAHGLVREIYAGIPGIGPVMERGGTQFENAINLISQGKYKEALAVMKGGMGTMTPILAGEAGKTPVGSRVALKGADMAGDIAKGVVEAPKEAPRVILREVSNAGKRAVEAEKGKVETSNAIGKSEYQEKANRARVQARSAYEAGEAEKAQPYEEAARKWESAAKQEKAAARGKYETTERRRVEVAEQNQKIEAAKKNLEQTAEGNTKQLTQNLKTTLDNAKDSFDKEYGEFDAKILGKSPQAPKGTLQASLNPVVEAVRNAKKNIIEGSEESIKQFESITKRSEMMETPAGEVIPVQGPQFMPAADLRGYVTELESKIYDSNTLPDVKNALKSVVEVGKKEVGEAIKDVHGQSAVNAYHDLNSRYSDYLTDWRDTSKTNPLPRVRSILLEGVAKNNPNYPVYLDIGRILKGGNAQKALALLDKYKKFGADPRILSEYQKTLDQLASLPKPKELKEPARVAQYKISEPPKPPKPTKVAEINYPEPPKLKKFDQGAFIREKVQNRMTNVGNWGSAFMLVRAISDAMTGRGGAAMTTAEEIAMLQAVKHLLTSPKVLDWVSREATK
jgi:hypothetical protein